MKLSSLLKPFAFSAFLLSLVSSIAFSAGDEVVDSAPKQQVTYVPSTVSDGARANLEFINSLGVKMLSVDVDMGDLDAVKAFNEQKTAEMKAWLNAEIIEQYNPTIVSEELNGVPVLNIIPADWDETKNDRVLVFLHGGGYVINSAESYIAGVAPLADMLKARVISVDYTTAPFAKFDEITDQVISVVRALNDSGHSMRNIGIYGDSAGGGLAVGSVLKMRDLNMELPAAVVAWSGWFDLTSAGDTRVTLDAHDPIVDLKGLDKIAAAYASEQTKHPYASPVYADFSAGPFPPVLLQGGTKEVFLSDWVRLQRAMKRAGHDVTLDLYEGETHVFQVFNLASDEAQEALKVTSDFFKDRLGVDSSEM